MELSTIIRLKSLPPVGLRPNLFPSGALVYSEPSNSMYYAGGDDGNSKATYIELINNTTSGGTVTSVDIASKTLDVSNSPITRYGSIDLELQKTGVLAGSYGSGGQVPVMTVDSYGRLTDVKLVPVNVGGTVQSVTIESNTLSITGSPVTTTGTISINLQATGVVPGIYGSGTNIPILTVDAFGRITKATSTTIEGAAGNVYHDFTIVGNGSSTSPLGTSLRSQLVLDNATKSIQNSSIVIGPDQQYVISNSARNISIGTTTLPGLNSAGATLSDNIALGNYSAQNLSTNCNRNISIGVNSLTDAKSASDDNISIGYNTLKYVTAPTNNVVLGSNAQSNASYTLSVNNIVIGAEAVAGEQNNTIIGYQASNYQNTDKASIAVGSQSQVGSYSIAVGALSSAIQDQSIAIGNESVSLQNSISIGYQAKIINTYPSITDGGIAFGNLANTNTSSIAVGANADSSSGKYSIAFGAKAVANFDYSMAIGYQCTTGANYELAIGSTVAPIGNPDGSGVEFSATGGSAAALPATPAAYLRVRINGTLYKIPLYNI